MQYYHFNEPSIHSYINQINRIRISIILKNLSIIVFILGIIIRTISMSKIINRIIG